MQLSETVLAVNSKASALPLVHECLNQPKLLKELLYLALLNQGTIPSKATWVMALLCELDLNKLVQHEEKLMLLLDPRFVSPVRRNVLRMFRVLPINEELISPLADRCLELLRNNSEDIATRAFSIHVLSKICKQIPEFFNEVNPLIEFIRFSNASPAIQSSIRAYQKVAQKNIALLNE